MNRTSKATVVTFALALLAELTLERALADSDVIAAILGAELLVPAGLLVLYVSRLALVLTVAMLGYQVSSWACRRGARAS